jgi:hypothetical protein
MRAYVFVNTKAGKAKAVARDLTKIKGVKAADACWGEPDIIVLVEVKNERALKDIVLASNIPIPTSPSTSLRGTRASRHLLVVRLRFHDLGGPLLFHRVSINQPASAYLAGRQAAGIEPPVYGVGGLAQQPGCPRHA